MAAVATAPGLPHAMYELDSHPLSTIRDPRTPDNERHEMAASNPSTTHPDLSSEVATLSNKLISAINHQTYLDDALTAARQELETTHGQVRSLEAENMEHFRQIKSGELVRRDDVDRIVSGFAEDRKRTLAAEQDKKRIEQELENLTTSLFEEANQVCGSSLAWWLVRCSNRSYRWSRPRGEKPRPRNNATTSFECKSRTPRLYWQTTRSSWPS